MIYFKIILASVLKEWKLHRIEQWNALQSLRILSQEIASTRFVRHVMKSASEFSVCKQTRFTM